MSQSYIVQSGDTLLKIAIDNDVPFTTLLELNPKYQPNPDLIHVGDSIRLPEEGEDEEVEQTNTVEPISKVRPTAETCTLMAAPECEAKEVHDVVFVTGEAMTDFYCLDEKSIQYMDEEAKCMDSLLEGYATLLKETPQGKNVTKQQVEQHAKKRQVWLNDASNAGAICLVESTEAKIGRKVASAFGGGTEKKNDENQQRVLDKLKALDKRKRIVTNYDESWFLDDDSVEVLKRKVLAKIEDEISYWQSLDKSPKKPEAPNKQSVNLDNFNSIGKQLINPKVKQHIVEVYSMRHNRYLYLRSEFIEQEKAENKGRWRPIKNRSKTMAAIENNDKAGFARAVKEDIQNDIKSKLSNGIPLEIKFQEWKADGGHWLEFKAAQHILTEEGETRFAISQDAQLLRWGAQAAFKADIKPQTGDVDVGFGAEASVSLVEGSVKIDSFLPYESGYPVTLNYKDANGKDATYSFGCFRTKGCLLLSAFVGGMASVGAQINNKKAPPRGDGSVGMLFTPRVGFGNSPKGQVGFKAEGFAGAQAGGQLSGGVEWLAPEKNNTLDFATLAEIKVEGNVAAGLGAGADFQLSLRGNKFLLICSGRLVWGAGGSGSFGAALDAGEFWNVTQIIWQGLQYIDYRMLKNIDEDTYNYLVQASYLAFASDLIEDPEQALYKTVEKGENIIGGFWKQRGLVEQRKKEAYLLSERIMNNSVFSGMPPDQLLPEVVGMMLNTLVEEFWTSMNEKQETAICELLKKTTYNWRKFEEILSRINDNGDKVGGDAELFKNLKRINTILDNEQQREFNYWVYQLAEGNLQVASSTVPFEARTGELFERKKAQVTQQIAMLNNSSELCYT
jgi:LysM repeat protein